VIITYSPADGESRRWDWDPSAVRMVDAEDMMTKWGKPSWDAFRIDVLQGSPRARRVLLWHLLRKDDQSLVFDSLDVAMGEVTVEMTRTELVEVRDTVTAMGGLDETQREMALAALDAQIAEADEDTAGKAPLPIGANSTGSPLPK
jgi:hypothetical protein